MGSSILKNVAKVAGTILLASMEGSASACAHSKSGSDEYRQTASEMSKRCKEQQERLKNW